MGKFLKEFWGIIIIVLLFILQTINVIWCFTSPNIEDWAGYFALFCDGFIFCCLVFTLKEL